MHTHPTIKKKQSIKYNLYKESSEHLEKRRQCNSCMGPEILIIFPESVLEKQQDPYARIGTCYDAALKKIFDLSDAKFKKLQSLGLHSSNWINIAGIPYKNDNFFYPINGNIMPNDLRVYQSCSDQLNPEIQHFAATNQDCTVSSQIGTSNGTYKTATWDLPLHYGTISSCWRLKKKYRGKDGKILLFKDLKKITYNKYRQIKENIQNSQLAITRLADRSFISSQEYIYLCTSAILKANVSLDIDAYNNQSETILMIAARNGNLATVKSYRQHNAQLDLKNKQMQTAYDIALANGHYDVAKELATSQAQLLKIEKAISLQPNCPFGIIIGPIIAYVFYTYLF